MEVFLYAGILLVFSALFSSSETALFILKSKKEPKTGLVGRLLKRPVALLNTLLLGNMVVNILVSNVVEGILSNRLFVGISYAQLKLFLVILTSTILLLIFGEVVPKNIGLYYPKKLAALISYPIYFFQKLLLPITLLLTKLTNFLMKSWTKKENDASMSQYEIRSIIKLSHQRGILNKEESDLIEKIVNFSHMEIGSLMFPRNNLLGIEEHESLDRAWKLMQENRFSKLLVYKENLDQILGFLHIRDLIHKEWSVDKAICDLDELIRPAHFVPDTKSPIEVLKILRSKKASFGVVLDEYGGTAGLITVNHIIRTIIGEYAEDSFQAEKGVFFIGKNEIIVNANRVSLREIKNFYKQQDEYWEDEEETVASFILKELDQIPEEGMGFERYQLFWQVMKMRERSIFKVRVRR